MNIWIAGKGGSGKTTVAGTLARLLARRGHGVLAVDLDPDPTLGLTVGLGPAAAGLPGVRERLLAAGQSAGRPGGSAHLLDDAGVTASDDVRLVQWSKIDAHAGPPCTGVTAGQLLGGLHPREGRDVVADLPAGLISSLIVSAGGPPDVLVVMAEPYDRSAEVARRLRAQADAAAIPRVLLVGNRVNRERDHATLRRLLGVDADVVVPTDPVLDEADRHGVAPLDHAPPSPLVAGVAELADHLAAPAQQTKNR